MAQPTTYERQFSFQSAQSAAPADPLPADKVDLELNQVKVTLDETLTNLALIQRDDGALGNDLVGVAQLAGTLKALNLDRPTNWATATDYVVDNAVFESNKLYVALEAHTSGVFATDLGESKWTLVVDLTTLVTDANTAKTGAETARDAALAAQTAAEAAQTASEVIETTLEQGGFDYYGDLSGTNAYTVADNGHAPAAYVGGYRVRARVVNANTVAVTLNPAGLGVKSVVKQDGSELVSGDWLANTIAICDYNATLGKFIWQGANLPGMASTATGERLDLTDANLILGTTGALSFGILKPDALGSMIISGGNGQAIGANIVLNGSGATDPSDILFRTGGTTRGQWDQSVASWDWKNSTIIGLSSFDLNSLTALAAMDQATDWIGVYDQSATAFRKYQVEDLTALSKRTLIETITLSGGESEIDFDNIPATYSKLELEFDNVNGSAVYQLLLQTSDDNGATYHAASGGASSNTISSATTGAPLHTTNDNASGTSVGNIFFPAYANALAFKMWHGFVVSDGAAAPGDSVRGIIEDSAGATDAVRLTPNAGTFDSGVARLYGWP